MLPMTIHTIITDIEEEEEGNKASPVHRRRRGSFDSSCKPKENPNQ